MITFPKHILWLLKTLPNEWLLYCWLQSRDRRYLVTLDRLHSWDRRYFIMLHGYITCYWMKKKAGWFKITLEIIFLLWFRQWEKDWNVVSYVWMVSHWRQINWGVRLTWFVFMFWLIEECEVEMICFYVFGIKGWENC